jgi:hypothetical protein
MFGFGRCTASLLGISPRLGKKIENVGDRVEFDGADQAGVPDVDDVGASDPSANA